MLHWPHVCLCVQVEVIVEETVRWSLKVSRETDEALRAHLGRVGGRKGDFSRFVQDAVKAKLKEKSPRDTSTATGRDRTGLAEAVREIRAKTKSLPRARFEKLVAEAVAYARRRR